MDMKRLLVYAFVMVSLLVGCSIPAASPGGKVVDPTSVPTQTALPSETPVQTVVPTATPVPAPVKVVAYIGADGNVWLVNAATGEKTPVTQDAAALSNDNAGDLISYQMPEWSSDGQYLAFERNQGVPTNEGYTFTPSLSVYDANSGALRSYLDNQQTTGYAWKPGTHLLAFGKITPPGYFTARGEVDSTQASGIWALDLDTGSVSELVRPESGYSLARPRWSPNGQFLSFYEIIYMEGQGPFAYYDFSAQRYTRWEQAIGSVDWSPDGSQILHDNMVYAPSYTERIFVINRDQSSELQLSPDVENAYAYSPLFSPTGDRIAYLDVRGMDPDLRVTLVLRDFPDGNARELAVFTQVYFLTWSPDGQDLLLAAGNYPETKVILVSTSDGSQQVLADGWQAAMQP